MVVEQGQGLGQNGLRPGQRSSGLERQCGEAFCGRHSTNPKARPSAAIAAENVWPPLNSVNFTEYPDAFIRFTIGRLHDSIGSTSSR